MEQKRDKRRQEETKWRSQMAFGRCGQLGEPEEKGGQNVTRGDRRSKIDKRGDRGSQEEPVVWRATCTATMASAPAPPAPASADGLIFYCA